MQSVIHIHDNKTNYLNEQRIENTTVVYTCDDDVNDEKNEKEKKEKWEHKHIDRTESNHQTEQSELNQQTSGLESSFAAEKVQSWSNPTINKTDKSIMHRNVEEDETAAIDRCEHMCDGQEPCHSSTNATATRTESCNKLEQRR